MLLGATKLKAPLGIAILLGLIKLFPFLLFNTTLISYISFYIMGLATKIVFR